MNGSLHEVKLVQKQQLNPQLDCSVYYVSSFFNDEMTLLFGEYRVVFFTNFAFCTI
jgi:hypothetical protein